MSLGAQRVLAASLVLVLLVLDRQIDERWPPLRPWPGAAAALIAPGVFHAEGQPDVTWLADSRPGNEFHLPRAALSEASEGRRHERRGLATGFLALLLAIYGIFSARGMLAIAGRLAFGLACVFTAWDWVAGPGAPLGLKAESFRVAIAALAGAGLLRLGRRAADGSGEGAAMVLGAAAVLLAGVLIAASLQAGAVTDARVVRPLLERIDAAGPTPGSWRVEALARPEVIAANATWLRAVLDRAALAAFVSMCVLLLHLKSRGTFTGLLIVLVVAADLISVRLLL